MSQTLSTPGLPLNLQYTVTSFNRWQELVLKYGNISKRAFRLWIYLAYRHLNTGQSHSISNEWEGVADAGGWPGAPVEEEIEGTINLESELPLLFSQTADGDHVDDGDNDVDNDGDTDDIEYDDDGDEYEGRWSVCNVCAQRCFKYIKIGELSCCVCQ